MTQKEIASLLKISEEVKDMLKCIHGSKSGEHLESLIRIIETDLGVINMELCKVLSSHDIPDEKLTYFAQGLCYTDNRLPNRFGEMRAEKKVLPESLT